MLRMTSKDSDHFRGFTRWSDALLLAHVKYTVIAVTKIRDLIIFGIITGIKLGGFLIFLFSFFHKNIMFEGI